MEKAFIENHFFGVTTPELLSYYEKSLLFSTKQALDGIKEQLSKELKTDNERKQLQEDIDEMYEKLKPVYDNYIKMLQSNSDKMLTVPPELIRTPKNVNLNVDMSDEEYKKLRKETEKLEKEYLQKKFYYQMLRNELDTIEKVIEVMNFKKDLDEAAEKELELAERVEQTKVKLEHASHKVLKCFEDIIIPESCQKTHLSKKIIKK